MKVKTRNVTVDYKTKDGRTVSVKGYETYQPERSKREDVFSTVHNHVHQALAKGEQQAVEEMMRCSEHDGNAVRDK